MPFFFPKNSYKFHSCDLRSGPKWSEISFVPLGKCSILESNWSEMSSRKRNFSGCGVTFPPFTTTSSNNLQGVAAWGTFQEERILEKKVFWPLVGCPLHWKWKELWKIQKDTENLEGFLCVSVVTLVTILYIYIYKINNIKLFLFIEVVEILLFEIQA